MSAGKYYNLKEIPFEPTGAGEIKYGYIPPEKFATFENHIKNTIREKKLYVLLINSPQGGGKSTMISEFERRVKEGIYSDKNRVKFISNRLLNLEISSYVADFLKESTSMSRDEINNYIKNSKPVLRDKIAGVLLDSTEKNDLTIWIIDEFDILIDQPEQEQRGFLQFLREIIDQIAKKKNQPIAFIMAHTQKSSKNFIGYLRTQHGPFVSRIVDEIELGYNFLEVKKIVNSRLKSISINERDDNNLTPFTEKSLRKLFDLINSFSNASSLTNFRLFERICYNAFIEGEKNKITVFDESYLRSIFEKCCPDELVIESGLSYPTRAIIAELKQNRIQYSTAILDGLAEAITKMNTVGFKIINTDTSYHSILKGDKVILAVLDIESKYMKNSFLFTVYLAVPHEKSIITSDDVEEIEKTIQPIINAPERYCNKIFFFYVSNIDINFDKFVWSDFTSRLSISLADDLAALSKIIAMENNEDTNELLKEFNSELASSFHRIINEEISDLTYMPADRVTELLSALYITCFSNNDRKITRNELKDKDKILFARSSKASDSQIKEIINLGFAKEESSYLIPAVPKTIKLFLQMLKKSPITKDGFKRYFTELADPLLDFCASYKMINIEDNLISPIYLDDLIKEAKQKINEIKNSIEKFNENIVFIKNLKLFLDAFNNIIEKEEEFIQFSIILDTEYFYEKIMNELEKAEKVSNIKSESFQKIERDISIDKAEDTTEFKKNEISPDEKIVITKEKTVEEAIIEIIQGRYPITLSDLTEELRKKGYLTNINSTLIKLIVDSKILLTRKG